MREVHKPSEPEELIAQTRSLAEKVGQISTGLKSHELAWNVTRKDAVMSVSYNLIKIIETGLLHGLTMKQLHALQMSADGQTDEYIAKAEGITKKRINHRKNIAKNKLNTRTTSQAVVEAIRLGLIRINHDETQSPPLTPLESRILRGYALGRTSVEMADMYGLDGLTVTSRQDGLREKLDAKNQVHAMKRAFELGIFDKHIDITDPEIFDQSVHMRIDGNDFDYRAAGLKHPDHIEMLVALTKLEVPIFSFKEIAGTDFYLAAQERGRQIVFGKAINSFMVQSEKALGEKVVERREKKRVGTKYAIRKPITIIIGDQETELPHTSEPIFESKVSKPTKPRHTPKPKPRQKPTIVIAPRVKVAKVEEVKQLEVPEKTEAEPLVPPASLDKEEIPSVEDALDNMKRRKTTETVLEARGVLHQIATKNYFGYSEKLVAALRYGVSFNALGIVSFRRANGEIIKISQIRDRLPLDNIGLKLVSASEVSGLSPYRILEIEEGLLSRHVAKHPVLMSRLEHVRAKKLELLKDYQAEADKPKK